MEDGSKKNFALEKKFFIVHDFFTYYNDKRKRKKQTITSFASLLLLSTRAGHCMADMVCPGYHAEKSSVSCVL